MIMTTDSEMTDAQVAAQVGRTDRFVADFRKMVAATAVDLRGGLLGLIDVHLLAVGAGPTLDFANATAFLARFEAVIEQYASDDFNDGLIYGLVHNRWCAVRRMSNRRGRDLRRDTNQVFTVPIPDGGRHHHCDGGQSNQRVLPVDNDPLDRHEH
jgi:hypothetical protein